MHTFFAISSKVIKDIYFKTLRPGKSFPSRYSRNAPPAVDKCVKVNFAIVFVNCDTVSPPPRIEIKDFLTVFSEIFFAIAIVPIEKFLFSKYPEIFHKIVFDLSITLSIISIVFGPIKLFHHHQLYFYF